MNGARAEHQLFSDLEVSQTTRQQAQHLYLACRQSSGVGWWGGGCGRRWSRFLSPGRECLLWRHRASLGQGGSEGSLSQVDTRIRDRAFVVSALDERNGYAKSVAQRFRCPPELGRPRELLLCGDDFPH